MNIHRICCFVALILALVSVCASQQLGQPFGPEGAADGANPNNNYPWGPSYVPWDQPRMQYCIRELASGKPIPYAPYNLSAYTVRTSGFHTHETEFTARPGPHFIDPTFGWTNADGCSQVFQVDLDRIAGWVGFCAESVGGKAKYCVNNFLWNGRANAPGSHFIAKFQPYPINTLVNKPGNLHNDDRHLSGGFSRYLGANYIPAFVDLSNRYRSATVGYALSDNGGQLADRADISRCSLPYGGLSDNDGPNFAPNPAFGGNWVTRPDEEHVEGEACDIVNPSYQNSQYPQLGILLLQAAHQSTCIEGAYSPSGIHLNDPDSGTNQVDYWLAQDKIHIVCGPRIPAITPPPGRR